MKRIFTVLTSIALTFALSFSAAFANDDALMKSQNYLKTITLDSPDAVLRMKLQVWKLIIRLMLY